MEQYLSQTNTLGGAKYCDLSEQQYFVWDTTSQNTKRQDMLEILES